MDKEQTMKRKRVPDPHQRTVTGAAVHILWRLLSIFLVICLFFGITGGVAAMRVFDMGKTYLEEDIIPKAHYDLDGVKLNQSSFLLARNPQTGEFEELRQLLALENRIVVSYEEIPRDMINATVAVEDKRFWEHDGVDWMRTLGASAMMFLGGSTFGGSMSLSPISVRLARRTLSMSARVMAAYCFVALRTAESSSFLINASHASEHCL